MRVLVFSDLQADDGSDRLRMDPSWPLQRWRIHQFYAWAARTVKERKLDAVWDLGDTTHNRSSISIPTLQAVMRGSAELVAGLSPALNFKLVGNHEQQLKSTDVHAADIFRGLFHVVEDREVFRISNLNITIICSSFTSDLAGVANWIHECDEAAKARGDRVVVLGHWPVSGSRLSSGATCSGVALPTADLVLLGHVHRWQELAPNAYYVGSPFQQDFGEAGDPKKRVAIVDLKTLEIEWITPTLVNGDRFPEHRIICTAELQSAVRTDDVLRVQIGSPAEAAEFYACKAVSSVQPVYAFRETGSEAASQESVEDFEALTRAYIDKTPLSSVSADELLAELHELMA